MNGHTFPFFPGLCNFVLGKSLLTLWLHLCTKALVFDINFLSIVFLKGFVPGEQKYEVVRSLFKAKEGNLPVWHTEENMIEVS